MRIGLLTVLCSIAFACAAQAHADRFRNVRLEDGVELWTPAYDSPSLPSFFAMLERLFRVALPHRYGLPFGDSVAFLVGVGDYEHLEPQLPFVENDLEDLRDFLLEHAGFDRVYVARDQVASRELVEEYMANHFRRSLNPEDRLLFYYAGHGADLGGTTGYIQFGSARPDDFAQHVLPIHLSVEWSRFIRAKHVLFIYDSCASGLAFTSRSPETPSRRELLATLSGNGSRTIISAGTAAERTYEVVDASGRGNGVFTRAFLDAMLSEPTDRSKTGFMTLDQVFARAFIGVQRFAALYGKAVTPRMWKLEENRYRGTFLFLDLATQEELASDVAELLRAAPRSPETDPDNSTSPSGSLSVSSNVWAEVSLDGAPPRQTPAYFAQLSAGHHELRVSRPGYEEQLLPVVVREGLMSRVRITLEPMAAGRRHVPREER